jgi:putative hemolysin
MGEDGFLLEIAVIAVLILLNAFFAGAEMAVVSARTSRLRALADDGNARAAAALRLKEDPDRFLATVQVGVTFVGTMASAVGGVAAIERLEPVFASFPVSWVRPFAEPIAVAIVVFAIAYLSLVVGELVPKSLAVRHAETLAIWIAPLVERFSRIAMPLVAVLTASSRAFLRLLGQKGADPVHFHSLEDLRAIAEEAARQGSVNGEIVTGAVEFHERDVREIMTPRPRVEALRSAATLDETVQSVRRTGHTRYPVYQDTIDEVIGFVHARDVYEAALDGREVALAALVRPALVVPASKSATALLEQMRAEGAHMALVVDEHGSFEGIVTLEDLIEVIVGEIEDEHRVEIPTVRALGDGRLEVDGSVRVHELNTDHELGLPESGDYVTVAGLVLDRLGRIPEVGQTLTVDRHRLSVLAVDGRRVARLRIEPAPAPRTADGAEPAS